MIKTRIVPTAVVLAVIFVAAYVFLPSLKATTKKDTTAVQLVVDFTPADRTGCPIEGRVLSDSVTIFIKVGPETWPVMRECRPLKRTVYPRRGDVVTIRAEQYIGVDLLCRITQVGYRPIQSKRVGPGHVQCRYKVN